MFDNLSDKLGSILGKLRKSGALSEADVTAALREVRVALLEADVALPVVKDLIEKIRVRAIGQDVLRSVTPGQMVVKIVHDHLVEVLGVEQSGINLEAVPPVPVLMVGLQGSGKTTSTAKIAKRLQEKQKKKVLMASLDVRRPAAQEQLKILGEQAGIATLPIIAGQMPVDIANRAMNAARLQGFDVVMLDTAGRLHIDAALMSEVQAVRDAVDPAETLLVADSLTGQDAVNVAKQFNEQVGITGVVLTRMDGDGRGGAALSMRAVTGKPIKLVGVGEKLDALEDFHPDRVANRILGMGDVVSLVEKAAETIDREDAERIAAKMKAGSFDLDDLRSQLKQMTKLGGMSSILGMLPGMGKLQQAAAQTQANDSMLKRQIAIIESMTPKERRNPNVLNASRKRRIAAGSGVQVQDVNRLLKMHLQMADIMKKVGKGGMKGLLGGLGGMGGLGGLGGGKFPGGPGGLPPGFGKFR